MKNTYWILIIGILCACERKELPEPVIEEPVFHFGGALNGESFNWSAGSGGLVADASIQEGVWGTSSYNSSLVPYGCEMCPGQFNISINSSEPISPWDTLDFEQDIHLGAYPYAIGDPFSDFLTLQFWSFPTIPGQVLWSFGSTTSMELNPTYTFDSPGPQVITLALDDGMCNSTISQTVSVGSDEIYSWPMQMVVLDSTLLLIQNMLDAESAGLNILQVLVDGESVPFDVEPFLISIAPSVEHAIQFTFQNADGDVGFYSITTVFGDDLCILPFFWSYITQSTPEYGAVNISYHHSNGNTYTSNDPSGQSPAATFEILAIEDYEFIIDEMSTKKVTIQLSCTLYNQLDSSDQIELNNAIGDFLFLVP